MNRRRGGANSAFARTKPIILLSGLAMVVLGVVILINPIAAVEALVRILGIIMVIYGIIPVVAAIMKGNPLQENPGELLLGGISLVAGLIMAIFPGQLTNFVWTIIGILVFITGVLDVMEAGQFRRVGSPLAMPATISGVITVIMGLVVIIAPAFSLSVGMLFAAVALFVDGVTEIIFGLGV